MEFRTYGQDNVHLPGGKSESQLFAEGKLHYDSRYISIVGQLDAMIEMLQQKPGCKLTSELDKLLDSMMDHIGPENNFMALVRYPEVTKHRNHHYYLFVMTDDLNNRSAMSQDVTCEELENIRHLWMMHIQMHDRAFEEFLALKPLESI